MPRRADPLAAEPDGAPPTNEEKILSVLKDAAQRTREGDDVLGLSEIATRSGIGYANASVYLSYLVRQGKAWRVAKGRYTIKPPAHPWVQSKPAEGDATIVIEESSIDEQAAEDIRAAERERIAAALSKAVADAVPREAQDYINGFRDGANFVAEQVLGLVLVDVKVTD